MVKQVKKQSNKNQQLTSILSMLSIQLTKKFELDFEKCSKFMDDYFNKEFELESEEKLKIYDMCMEAKNSDENDDVEPEEDDAVEEEEEQVEQKKSKKKSAKKAAKKLLKKAKKTKKQIDEVEPDEDEEDGNADEDGSAHEDDEVEQDDEDVGVEDLLTETKKKANVEKIRQAKFYSNLKKKAKKMAKADDDEDLTEIKTKKKLEHLKKANFYCNYKSKNIQCTIKPKGGEKFCSKHKNTQFAKKF